MRLSKLHAIQNPWKNNKGKYLRVRCEIVTSKMAIGNSMDSQLSLSKILITHIINAGKYDMHVTKIK